MRLTDPVAFVSCKILHFGGKVIPRTASDPVNGSGLKPDYQLEDPQPGFVPLPRKKYGLTRWLPKLSTRFSLLREI